MPYGNKPANKISYEQAFAKDKEGLTKKYGSKEGFIKAAKAYNVKKYGTTEPTKTAKDLGVTKQKLAAANTELSKKPQPKKVEIKMPDMSTKAFVENRFKLDPTKNVSLKTESVVTPATNTDAGAKDKMSRQERKIKKLGERQKKLSTKINERFKAGKDVSMQQARILKTTRKLRDKKESLASKQQQPNDVMAVNNDPLGTLDKEAAALGSKKLGMLMKPANYVKKADMSAFKDVKVKADGVADAYMAVASKMKMPKEKIGPSKKNKT